MQALIADGHSGAHFGTHSGSILWIHSGGILGPFGGHSGPTLGPVWANSGAILGPSWAYSGSILGPLWAQFPIFAGVLQNFAIRACEGIGQGDSDAGAVQDDADAGIAQDDPFAGIVQEDSDPDSDAGILQEDSDPDFDAGIVQYDSDPELLAGIVGGDSDPDPDAGVGGIMHHDSDPDTDPDAGIAATELSTNRPWTLDSLSQPNALLLEAVPNRNKRKRLAALLQRFATDKQKQCTDYQALATAFDATRLQVGDFATTAQEEAKDKHMNAWDYKATIKLAFDNLGSTLSHSLRATGNVLDAMTAAALAATFSQKACVKLLYDSVVNKTKALRWLIVLRQWDGTPIDVEFGLLQEQLVELARYRHLDDDGNWSLLKHKDALKHRKATSLKRGVLEMFAQTIMLVWPESAAHTLSETTEDADVHRVEYVITPPSFIENTTASCEYTALQSACEYLSTPSLCELSKHIPFITLVLGSDFATANVRLKSYTQHRVGVHNATSDGKILIFDLFCIGHIITRMVIAVFSYVELIPKCYAVAFTLRFPKRLNRFLKVLQRVIEEDLSTGGYFPNATPDPLHLRHTWCMLALTFFRPRRTHEQKDNAYLTDVFNVLRSLLTADIRRSKVKHLCRQTLPGRRAI
jgi:hypothetical protein